MDDLPFSWYNLHDHDNHEEQSFNFDSESLFLNQIHDQLAPTDWGDEVMAADLASSNSLKEIKNNEISISTTANPTTTAIATATSIECLLSGTNGSTDASDEIFSDGKSLWRDNIVTGNNNVSGVSSGDSVTDDGAISQCTSGKLPICGVDAPKPKRSRSNVGRPTSSNINFQQPGSSSETDMEAIAQMKEMIYREAAFRPVSFTAETVVDKPKRKNVRISSDPQTVAARQRRERVSERIRALQKLVPGGNKMDTASMLDEAANYLKFLRSQVKALEQVGQNSTTITANSLSPIITHPSMGIPSPYQNAFSMQLRFPFPHENLYPSPPPE
ncbi:unnamed protein product [Lactuca saligna]|uniref:BHLH domain-containing protein n=1 Tax=Lactuca saligna TaxID=75948 RepID=A0AA35VF24_LACSI|nr:unnamed protein product [Lactuca saligna]